MSIDTLIKNCVAPARAIRRLLHENPEIGYQEFETAKVIRNELNRLGVKTLVDIEGVPTATLGFIGDESKPCVALRADIDALPIHEKTGLPYASKVKGMMHACGHDGHTANLLATAAVLKQLEGDLPVCVKLIFQPAEEGGGGGERLVKAGALDGRLGPKVTEIYGLHGWPGMPLGTISSRPGPIMAATDTFRATFKGVGCHGAFPHLGRDPIVAAAASVGELQHVITRELDPTEPVVITVGTFHAGTATNVIPDVAQIAGTIRTLNDTVRKFVCASVVRRLNAIAESHRVEVSVIIDDGYPATINHVLQTARVASVAREALGPVSYFDAARPVMGGEDFAYYLEAVPGCFFFVGLLPQGEDQVPTLHSDRFDFNDDVLETTVKMFVSLVTSGGTSMTSILRKT